MHGRFQRLKRPKERILWIAFERSFIRATFCPNLSPAGCSALGCLPRPGVSSFAPAGFHPSKRLAPPLLCPLESAVSRIGGETRSLLPANRHFHRAKRFRACSPPRDTFVAARLLRSAAMQLPIPQECPRSCLPGASVAHPRPFPRVGATSARSPARRAQPASAGRVTRGQQQVVRSSEDRWDLVSMDELSNWDEKVRPRGETQPTGTLTPS